MVDPRRYAPATARNREPILDFLRRWVGSGRAIDNGDHTAWNVLEVASGSGEHAVYLAPRLPVASWQPSDADADCRASIDAWRAYERAERVLPAIDLDVTRRPWPKLETAPDLLVCVNMIHIAPWVACERLLDGAAALLAPGKLLYLYGPYRRDGRHTAPSNEAFDASLRARNPEWGVRDLEAVTSAARERGLEVAEIASMPSNNLSLLLSRT
ncbi:MAG TPA: DUF938 domain-containing protein [Labilithrix sp.]|jgi:hypothetical protein|nr:DUF938 domain-containing protein [Labilithrix sp.]